MSNYSPGLLQCNKNLTFRRPHDAVRPQARRGVQL